MASIARVFFVALLMMMNCNAFTVRRSSSGVATAQSSTQLFFFGAPKDDGSPGDYVCKVRQFFMRNIRIDRLQLDGFLFVSIDYAKKLTSYFSRPEKKTCIMFIQLILQIISFQGLWLRLYQGT
jgi:hypothetical protein